MNEQTIIQTEHLHAFVIPNTESFIKSCNAGWGNGYVSIARNHPFYKRCVIEKHIDNTSYYSPQIADFEEEITLTEWSDDDSLLIGWDSAHSYQNIHNYPESVIIERTQKLFNIINNYLEADLNAYKAHELDKFCKFIQNV